VTTLYFARLAFLAAVLVLAGVLAALAAREKKR
jgi:hypothetical protein